MTALRGAVGFLTRVPLGHDEAAWDAFTRQPAVLPLVGYGLGAAVALPLALPLPATTAVALFLAWLYLLTGITHVDGLVDLGDALVVHGSPERRREVMTDTTVGVGGVLTLVVTLAALGLGALPVVGWSRLLLLVVVAEVGAKAAMATVVCLGEAAHEGLGSSLTDHAGRGSLALVLLATAPAALLTVPSPAAGAALLAALAVAGIVCRVADRLLGGVSGDVLGATNELARVAALHTGVVVWTLS